MADPRPLIANPLSHFRSELAQGHGKLCTTMAWKRPTPMDKELVGTGVGHNGQYPAAHSNQEVSRRGDSQKKCPL
jgi:hypothetical protein